MAESINSISVKRYRRHWAVYADGDLIAVTLYKKGANSVASVINELLLVEKPSECTLPLLTLEEMEKWDASLFQHTFLGSRGIHAWSRFRSASFQNALKLAASKMPESLYSSFAFTSMPATERLSILHRFAQGELSVELYWPILISCFVDALEQPRKKPVAGEATIEDCQAAYSRLLPSHRELLLDRVRGLLTWENATFTISRRNPPVVYNPSSLTLSKYGTELSDESLHLLLQKTVGQVGFYCFLPHLDEAGEVIAALGSNGPMWYYLTLDFQTEAISAVNPLPQHPWAFTRDPLPTVETLSAEEQKILPRLTRPPTESSAFDYCGCYFWDEKVGPHIVLRVQRIADCAKRVGVPFERLFALAWIHEFAHLVHLGVPDADGLFNPRQGDEFAELVAQWATWRTTQKYPALRHAFESLSRRHALIFHSWKPLNDCASEEFRSFLWCLRTGREGFERLDFMKRLFALAKTPEP